MKKYILNILAVCTGSLLLSSISLANIRSLEINADMESVDSMAAAPGTAFLPDFRLEDEDAELLNISFDSIDGLNVNNPTLPYTLSFRIMANNDVLDDELKIRGRGFRSSYVDYVSVDNTEAKGRLMVYPFYQLMQPEDIHIEDDRLRWSAGDSYTGAYELVMSYTDSNGEHKNVHRKTRANGYSLSGLKGFSVDRPLSVAIRGLPTEEIAYERAELDKKNGIALWSPYNGSERYRVLVKWTDKRGVEHRREETVRGLKCNVASEISSDRNCSPVVMVRAIPSQNDAGFYNIAVSEWARWGADTADTSDYEIRDIWEMLADYQGVSEGAFAVIDNAGNAAGSMPGSASSGWKRAGHRFSYIENGNELRGCWKKIGGYWYYFDDEGFLYSGWLKLSDSRYYLNEEIGEAYGRMLTGEQYIGREHYSFLESGELRE